MRFINALKTKLNIQTKKQMITVILLTLAIALTLGLGIFTLARYVSEKRADGLITPAEFYFESDLLTTDGKSYTTGVNSIGFELRAYGDNNRPSEVDVDYTVSISCSDNSVALPSGTNTSGTIAKGGNKVTVSYDGLALGKKYTVTARSTSPYSKTLSATFTVESENTALVVDKSSGNDGFVYYMSVKTGNVPVDAVVGWQRGYVPDNSYSALDTASGISHLVTFEPNSTYNFRFFKSDLSVSCDPAQFDVTPSADANTMSGYFKREHYNSEPGQNITLTGETYMDYGSGGAGNYSATGYMTISRVKYDASDNSHIQIKVGGTADSTARFLLWDSNSNGKFGIGRQKSDGGTYFDERNESNNPGYADYIDVTQEPQTFKWQVVVYGTDAYLYIDGKLVDTMSIYRYDGTTPMDAMLNIGALRADIEVFGVDIVKESENPSYFNSIFEDLDRG